MIQERLQEYARKLHKCFHCGDDRDYDLNDRGSKKILIYEIQLQCHENESIVCVGDHAPYCAYDSYVRAPHAYAPHVCALYVYALYGYDLYACALCAYVLYAYVLYARDPLDLSKFHLI